MIVATATDSNYVEITSVLLASVAAHSRSEINGMYVFCDGLSAKEKDTLRESYADDNITLIDLDDSDIAFLSSLPGPRLSRSAYVRLLMPSKLGHVSGRLLYLDCDTLVTCSLEPLANIDLEPFIVAAVLDDIRHNPAEYERRLEELGLAPHTPYFNSGVMLIDLDRWREADISRRVAEFRRSHLQLRGMDQDSLNAVFHGEWKQLPPFWNFHGRAARFGPPEDARNAGILHFTGRYKPNYVACDHSGRGIFLEYRSRTPWAGKPLKRPAKHVIRQYKNLIRSIIGRISGLGR